MTSIPNGPLVEGNEHEDIEKAIEYAIANEDKHSKTVDIELVPAIKLPATTGLSIGLIVSDVDEAVNEALSRGGKLVKPPANWPYSRNAAILDPDGNRIELSDGEDARLTGDYDDGADKDKVIAESIEEYHAYLKSKETPEPLSKDCHVKNMIDQLKNGESKKVTIKAIYTNMGEFMILIDHDNDIDRETFIYIHDDKAIGAFELKIGPFLGGERLYYSHVKISGIIKKESDKTVMTDISSFLEVSSPGDIEQVVP